jgi:hypothetical protein
MGIVFGVTGAKEPPYSLIHSNAFEVRRYEPYFVAEVRKQLGDNKEDNESFSILAKYIGVFGKPQNIKQSSIAMTAPVVTNKVPEKIAMTTPVVTSNDQTEASFMQFILPFEYKQLNDVPKPTDERVSIRQIPSKVVAVNRFSGSANKDYFLQQYHSLKKLVEKEDLVDNIDELDWTVAQYHPPFTLPFMRRNEIWMHLEDRHISSKLRAMIDDYDAK